MIHWLFVSAMISLFVFGFGTIATFVVGLCVGVACGQIGTWGYYGLFFAQFGFIGSIFMIIINYAWGGWW